MPLSIPLSQLKRELEDMLLDIQYLATALQRLRDLLPEHSEKRVTVLTLLGRLNDANKKALRGVLEDSALQVEYNSIRSDLSDLVQGLEDADFDEKSSAPGPSKGHGGKQGNVLYRIPHTMPLGKETECVVRIALSEDAIVEEITLDNQVVLKDLSRVSDLMQVELTDPARQPVFNIRSTSTAQQLITEEGYTQWFFYVEPLLVGTHPLEVKVSVLEMALNQVARKEIVFRETIQIFTEGSMPPPEPPSMPEPTQTGGSKTPPGFKSAGQAFTFQGSSSDIAYDYRYETKSAEAPPSEPPAMEAPSSSPKGLRTLSLFLAFILLGSTATWALTPPATRDWWVASIQDTPEAYASYIEKYPEAPNTEKASYYLAERTERLADLRAYAERYPDGRFINKVTTRISNLEDRALASIKEQPTEDNIRKFATDFPESNRLSDIKQAVEARATNRAQLMAEVEDVYVRRAVSDPSPEKVHDYLADFPDAKKLEEVHAAVSTKPEILAKVQPELEDAYLKKIQENPTTAKAEEFLEKFPEPVQKEKFEKILEQKPAVKKEITTKMRKMEAARKQRLLESNQ